MYGLADTLSILPRAQQAEALGQIMPSLAEALLGLPKKEPEPEPLLK